MKLRISELDFNHRIIILLDINGFSKMNDNDQVAILDVINKVFLHEIKSGGWSKEHIDSHLISSGDGFYILANSLNSFILGSIFLYFALSIRNALLKGLNNSSIKSDGIKIAIHFGKTLPVKDVTGKDNYVGSGMNECSRLLSPINNDELKNFAIEFCGHTNYVIVSEAALEKIDTNSIDNIIMSNEFIVFAKHDLQLKCRLIDMKMDYIPHLISIP